MKQPLEINPNVGMGKNTALPWGQFSTGVDKRSSVSVLSL